MSVSTVAPPRSWLYAPGNNPRLLQRVFIAGSDAVILNLEDAVPPGEKELARAMVADAVRARAAESGPAVFVRVNHPDTGLTRPDIQAVVGPGLDGLRLPKVESADTVACVDDWIAEAEARAGLSAGAISRVCKVESAAGVWHAEAIPPRAPACLGSRSVASTSNAMSAQQLVPTDRKRCTRAHARCWHRGWPWSAHLSRVSTPSSLMMRAWSGRRNRVARSGSSTAHPSIHPRQVPIINRISTPAPEEIAWARRVVQAAQEAERSTGSGALQLPDGRFIDVAVVRRAEALLYLADALGGAP